MSLTNVLTDIRVIIKFAVDLSFWYQTGRYAFNHQPGLIKTPTGAFMKIMPNTWPTLFAPYIRPASSFPGILIIQSMPWTPQPLIYARAYSNGRCSENTRLLWNCIPYLFLGNISVFVDITDGKLYDINILDLIGLEPDCSWYFWQRVLTLSRGYIHPLQEPVAGWAFF